MKLASTLSPATCTSAERDRRRIAEVTSTSRLCGAWKSFFSVAVVVVKKTSSPSLCSSVGRGFKQAVGGVGWVSETAGRGWAREAGGREAGWRRTLQ